MKILIFITTLFVLPNYIYAGTVINELMYDTEGTDSKREWIEIYSDENIDLETIKILENNVNHSIKLFSDGEKSNYYIVAGDPPQFLLDNPDFKGILYDSVFSLNNSGETLELVDSSGTTIDSITYNSDLGANGTGNSLQKSGGILIPAKATPGKENGDIAAQENEEKATTSTSTKKENEISAHSSYIELSDKVVKTIPIGAGRDRIISINTPIEFVSTYNEEDLKDIKFNWIFGNGFQKRGEKVVYTYKHEGAYNLVLHAQTKGDYAISRSKITVFKPDFDFGTTSIDGEEVLYITNKGNREVNIGGFIIKTGNNKVIFPQDTIIVSSGTIIIDEQLIGTLDTDIEFQYPNGDRIIEIENSLLVLEEIIKDISSKIGELIVENQNL